MMPDFAIVDTHLHLWDPTHLRYPWLDGNALLNQPYLLADYNAATAAQPIEKMVFVQCEADFAQFMEEADWVSRIAEQDQRIAGIVPWAPLENGDAARPALERLAANPRIKGIRRIIQFEADPDFCLRPGFIEGVRGLADYGLHFEICINHTQMENAITLVKACPNVRFMLDHIAKPDIKHHVMEPWRTHLKTFADMDNVTCKMSGLVVEADWDRWTKADLKPYIDTVIECFGFERLVFGGDWPVVLQAARWQTWLDTLTEILAGVSQAELKQLFHDNAVAFYRLA